MIKTLILLLSLLITGCAGYKVGPSDIGQASDSLTTAVALYEPFGVYESNVLIANIVGNPAGMVGVALFKQGLAYTMKSEWFYKKGQAYIGCSSYSAIVFGVGSAAAINNIIVLAAEVSIG